jgi:hypothetical protein
MIERSVERYARIINHRDNETVRKFGRNCPSCFEMRVYDALLSMRVNIEPHAEPGAQRPCRPAFAAEAAASAE